APDELAWLSRLAERFGIDLSPHPSVVFEEVSEIAFGGIPFGEVGERAALPQAAATPAQVETTPEPARPEGLRLVRYRPLFSGPAVERTPELGFQRPDAELELSEQDAQARQIRA